MVVYNNRFVFDPTRIGSDCTKANACGFNGVFSNYGTYPDWSPYKGTMVMRNITLRQHNVFRDNTYFGPWRFMARGAGNAVSWGRWRARPLSQDAGSRVV